MKLSKVNKTLKNRWVFVLESDDGYVDADHANCERTRKSTTRCVFTIGGGAVSWMSCMKNIVVLSLTSAKYVALTKITKEMI